MHTLLVTFAFHLLLFVHNAFVLRYYLLLLGLNFVYKFFAIMLIVEAFVALRYIKRLDQSPLRSNLNSLH